MALTAKKVYAILKRQISDMEAKLNSPVRYRGTVATADLLPLNPDIGDMYNIESKSVYGEAGMNVAWNGVVWDTMGAPIDMSLYIKSSELADWVKQQNKPAYTAEEVGALPADTKIPSKTSDLQNDSGFLTEIPDNYLSGTDKTLSASGKAADAKTTGDKFTEMSADISKKLDKNQGSENSGKIAGINESGDIVPMFPVGVEYNSETNCLEFGTDQKMKLNQGIGLDSSLTKTGYAADAGVVGEVTNLLKEDFTNLKEYVKGANLPETWEQVVLAIKSKLHKEMYAVGDRFSNIWKDTNDSSKEYDNPLRINHFEDGLELEDGTTVDGMWLQTVYAHLKGVQFSHQQAFYVSGDGMVAGTYCVGFDYTWGDKGYVTKGDYWNFTLTKDVPAGGKLAGFYGAPDQPQTNWRVYVYSADGKTVLETVSAVNKGQEGTLLGVMTAYGDENLNGIHQMAYGDNRYATSVIRQYLNSDKPKGEWWTAQTKWDIAPDQFSQIDGYLCGMDPELLAVLKPVKVVTYCNTVTATGQKQVKDITYDKVTLISLEQMYIEPQAAGEGEAHEYYKELNGTAKKFQWWQTYEILKTFAVENPTSPRNVRLRSANRGNASSTWLVYSSGYVNYDYASYASRPAPLMFIGAAPSDTISAFTDAESVQKTVI